MLISCPTAKYDVVQSESGAFCGLKYRKGLFGHTDEAEDAVAEGEASAQ
jgi:hypothetical protein